MERALKWTERASSDIEAIVRHLARRDPEAAGRIGMGAYERAQELVRHPELGSLEASLHGRVWHKLIYRRWKISALVDRSPLRQSRSQSGDGVCGVAAFDWFRQIFIGLLDTRR